MLPKNPILGLCQQATFMISAAKVDQCPADEGLEVAFAGRSNAGKSSALNNPDPRQSGAHLEDPGPHPAAQLLPPR